MSAYAAGDAGAFELLYRRHKDALYRYFLRHVDAADAAELFQDVWKHLIGSRRRYRPSAAFSAWLFTMAHHRLMDHFRRTRPTEALPESLAQQGDGPERVAQQQQTVARVLSALNALPLEQREVIVLREERELTLEQIAEVQGVGRETVKSRLRYALAKLREVLHEHG